VASISETLAAAVKHHQAGRLEQAARLYQQVLRAAPKHASSLHLLGVIALQTGDPKLAVRRIRRAIRSDRKVASFHANLAAAYMALRQFDEAVASCRRALQLKPDYAAAHNNLGGSLKELGRFDEAEASCRRAVQLAPELADAHNNLGNALKELGKFEEAEASFRRALEIRPDLACAHSNLGRTLHDQEKLDEAEASYRRALQFQPDFADALANLALLCERLNRWEEADSNVAEGLEVAPDHPHVNLVAAKCEKRQGRYPEAIDRLLKLRRHAQNNRMLLKKVLFELGQVYDRNGEPSLAFACFEEANRLAMQGAEDWGTRKQRYLDEIDALTATFTKSWVKSWSPTPECPVDQTPVFLIGFPRSGTTLLDVVLDSHPSIRTLQERPAIDALRRSIDGVPEDYSRALPGLTPEQIIHSRGAYFHVAGKYVARQPGTLLVDKLPLNTVNAGLILRVFPAARFILVVRHPCDACLSCFMQDFTLNDAMSNYLRLEDTTLLYGKVMHLWRQYLRVLPISYHMVRYEELVDDFEGQTRRLLEFLNVPWDDAVLGYADHAKTRGKIHTPSYSQVSEAIYRRARYRWQRYASYFEPLMPLLEPHIEYFGYQTGDSPSGVPEPHFSPGRSGKPVIAGRRTGSALPNGEKR
jgi:tetratricopeptide (TPR) repeat protein